MLFSVLKRFFTTPVNGRPVQKFYLEVYGCQMNVNDGELVAGILSKNGQYEQVKSPMEANIALLMTCSIRESAEEKIWNRLEVLASMQKKENRQLSVIGVLGCMAERLKLKVFERKQYINVVCGPDSYRHLPLLLESAFKGEKAVDVDLSMHETYEEELIDSVRNPLSKSAFVSIMRGCNNMCTFCIVPFTRGRERSRSPESIEKEIQVLSEKGIKEVTLLGQNVNSYNYVDDKEQLKEEPIEYSEGFRPLFKPRYHGVRFTNLLDSLSAKYPAIRFRFTSPHPREFPEDLLYLVNSRPNIARHIHLPLQSGSSAVLERMRRGYTREAYLDLVSKIRSIIPGVGLSTDVMAGFCGETEEDHLQTIDVFEMVGFDMAYMYAYSMREKTAAYRRYDDDVPDEVKHRRLSEIIEVFKKQSANRLDTYVGTKTVVMIEGDSKRSALHLSGRSSENNVVVIPKPPEPLVFNVGDFVRARIISRKGSTLLGEALI